MGKKGPRHGSLAYWHRKRAEKMAARVRTWNTRVKGLSGFAGYKAGMLHVMMIDDSESPLKGQEVSRAATVVEVPPVYVYSIVAYRQTPLGLKAFCEVPAVNAPKAFSRVHTIAKKAKKTLEELQGKAGEISEVRIVAFTQPEKTGLGKKTPEALEIAVGGAPKEALEFAAGVLGKQVGAKQVLREGEFVDVIAVTKGKGWQGVVRRYGVALNIRKATQTRRHGGSIGAERQAKVMYSIPRPGQMGFHRRTDRMKRVLRLGEDGKTVSPVQGFKGYGNVKTAFVLVDGSIPGPSKRLVRFRKTLVERKDIVPQILDIIK